MRFSHRWRMERVADELKATDTKKTASEPGGFFMPRNFGKPVLQTRLQTT
jgi:hypothetical protein